MYRASKTRRFPLVLLLLTTLLVVGDRIARAGDQDGIAGYKFKIYDSDGDGIDGNEPNNGSVGGASVTTGEQALRSSDDAAISTFVVTIRLLRHWLIWFR